MRGSLLAWAACTVMLAPPGSAEEPDGSRRSSGEGPNAVETQLEDDAREKQPWIETGLLAPWDTFKQNVHKATGLSFGFDYSAQYYHAEESLVDDDVIAGMVRLYGAWELVGRGKSYPGRLIYKVEHRQRYSDRAPSALSLDAGNVGIVAPPFNNDEFRLTNLFWRQGLAGERFVIQVGFLDVTDYLDVYGMSSPWLHFANLAFSTGSAAIPLPGDATLGMTAGAWLSENLYLHAGIADLNADPTEPWDGFENFFGDREYFTHVELGWTSGRGNQYLDNVHLTFWHVDERDETLTDDGWGFNFSAAWWLADAWLPFLRAGYTDDGGSLLSKSVSVGIGYQPPSGRDVLGLAFNWGKPNSNSFGPGRHDQYAIELFYRIQLLQHLAITPSFQWIGEPALNARDDAVWLFGLRVRLAL